MEQTVEQFFHDFRQELLAGAEVNCRFQLDEFMEIVAAELLEAGFTEGFELCHFRAQRGMRVDGYWFDDEGRLDLFIADFDSRSEMESLVRTGADGLEAIFKRLANFFEASIDRNLADGLESTSPEYGLARQIADRRGGISSLNLILFSERTLSKKIQSLAEGAVAGIPASYHVWDMSRLHRLRSSRGHKEVLDLNFEEMFGRGIPSLEAHAVEGAYRSYLMVMPAEILASLYGKFGARLLEQNVRTFLQARGSVNKGIRATILNESGMFFAYNNGITATAQEVETKMTASGLAVTRIIDLQIVNGGQTTASLFHTQKKDEADLSQIFVQMKMAVIDSQQSETVVPKISEYANTQNRINAADFFSNHPFHVRMEDFSRRIWAPAQKGVMRETKWFYERARGQYADAQSKLTLAEQKRFKMESPKSQMFTKTDLAKFENVWDEHPRWVNQGAQKNFAQYATRIGKEWEKSPDAFNEFYFKRAVARGLIFRAAERIVSRQPWYNGGYRANIVAYTLAVLGDITRRRKESIDFLRVWDTQMIDSVLEDAIAVVAREVSDDITKPPPGISNISEWSKREACWTKLQERIDTITKLLPKEFYDRLASIDEQTAVARSAKQIQRMDNGIEAQKKVLLVPAVEWGRLHQLLLEKGLLTQKEEGVLKIAMRIPSKMPTEKQSLLLLDILDKSRMEGVSVSDC